MGILEIGEEGVVVKEDTGKGGMLGQILVDFPDELPRVRGKRGKTAIVAGIGRGLPLSAPGQHLILILADGEG